MSENSFISTFTPSQMPPGDLEEIFVQRHDLLRDAEDRVRDSVVSGDKHHLLFVGPRGSGKTHFVSLLVHRLGLDSELEQKLDIAWLNEDETCTSFLDLLIKIYEALSKRYPERFEMDRVEPVYEKETTEAEEFLGSLLTKQLGNRTCLIAVENLDSLFQSIGNEGQTKLRAFLQEHPVFPLVATAQTLVDELTDRDGPFFGFFQAEHLKPLLLADAIELLGKIAKKNEDVRLTAFLASAKGRARVRALLFLSGGNHRIFVVLSQFITRESIEELVLPFKKMVDELTPYYQERVRALPPLQRKIVEFLCKSAETVPVKEIAKRMLGSSHQSVSKQLMELRGKGYVKSSRSGRESLYEVAEPLMRMGVEVKENQNFGPFRLLVDFIRIWYESDELIRRRDAAMPGTIAFSYLESAIIRMTKNGNLRKEILVEDLQTKFLSKMPLDDLGDFAGALQDAPEELVLAFECLAENKPDECLELIQDSGPGWNEQALLLRGIAFFLIGDFRKAEDDFKASLRTVESQPEIQIKAHNLLAYVYEKSGRLAKGLKELEIVINLDRASPEQKANALLSRGRIYERMGESKRAIENYSRVLQFKSIDANFVARALNSRGNVYGEMGKFSLALADFTRVIEMEDAGSAHKAIAYYNRGVAYTQAGEIDQKISDFSSAIQEREVPNDILINSFNNRGVGFGERGDYQNSIQDFKKILELESASHRQQAVAHLCIGLSLTQLGEIDRAIAEFTSSLKISGIPADLVADILNHRARARGSIGDNGKALSDLSKIFELDAVRGDTLARAKFYRGVILTNDGKFNEALEEFKAITGAEGIQSETHSEAYLACALLYARMGQWDETLRKFDSGLKFGKKGSQRYSNAFAELIGILYQAGIGKISLEEFIFSLLEISTTRGVLAELGESLLRHLSLVASAQSDIDTDWLKRWAMAWMEGGGELPELEMSMRMFRHGVQYLCSEPKDDTILHHLVSEERTILRHILGLESDNQ